MPQVTMRDGRVLDVQVEGPDDGHVAVFFHGTPGSRVPPRDLVRSAIRHGLRFVTWSRPGFGGSSRLRGRRIVDVVADTEDVLAHLGVDECVVGGGSGGGPHALACGARLDAARAVLCNACVAPFDAEGLDFLGGMGKGNHDELDAILAGEDTLRTYLEAAVADMGDVTVDDVLRSLSTVLPPVDRAVITAELAEDMVASRREAIRTGVDGWLDDDLAFVTDWGFELDEIEVPVTLWQGSEDLMVPFTHGQWLAERIPDVHAHLEQGEGHMSIGVGHVDEMLDELVELAGWE
ncbi:alpha/beta fold hydrolase [Salsipaludibacter albus]|uniref:alpha/beta fold hydrolase n=1 Tax=Salsipaludibacter albus TaxID=2849650 RepID=UPI001EE4AD6B|nr:alpha/beta hydrolase [Salsipaludibacter albus]MBY5162081.1 alpha/beta hydrolase [Salsipaludibacter albus]